MKKIVLIGVVTLAAVVVVVVWMLRARIPPPTASRDVPTSQPGRAVRAPRHSYKLVADGALETAVVRIGRASALLVELNTGQCRRLFGGMALENARIAQEIHPSGHAIIGQGRTGITRTVLDFKDDAEARVFRKQKKPSWKTWDEEAKYFFYDPHANTLTRFPRTMKRSIVVAFCWLPGTDLLAVCEMREEECTYLVDSKGKTISTLPDAGPWAGLGGVVNTYRRRVSKSGTLALGSVSLTSADGGETTQIRVREGQAIAGWSPDGRYVLVCPSPEQFSAPIDIFPFPKGLYVSGIIDVERGEDLNEGTGASLGVLPVSLWDRSNNETSHLLDVPLRVPHASSPDAYSETPFLITTRGILAFLRRDAGEDESHLEYFDFKGRRWAHIPTPLPSDSEWVSTIFVSSDGTDVLLWATVLSASDGSAEAGASEEPEKSSPEKMFLVRPEALSAQLLPIHLEVSVCHPTGFTLVQDGTILAIENDDLIRYDPETDQKRVIVEDLFETWKRKGDEIRPQ